MLTFVHQCHLMQAIRAVKLWNPLPKGLLGAKIAWILKGELRQWKCSHGSKKTCVMVRSRFAMGCWMSGKCSEALLIHPWWLCAHPVPWTFCEHHVLEESREEISAQEIGCCRRNAPSLPFSHDHQIYSSCVMFNDFKRISTVRQKSFPNKTSRYAPDSLLLLNKHLSSRSAFSKT